LLVRLVIFPVIVNLDNPPAKIRALAGELVLDGFCAAPLSPASLDAPLSPQPASMANNIAATIPAAKIRFTTLLFMFFLLVFSYLFDFYFL